MCAVFLAICLIVGGLYYYYNIHGHVVGDVDMPITAMIRAVSTSDSSGVSDVEVSIVNWGGTYYSYLRFTGADGKADALSLIIGQAYTISVVWRGNGLNQHFTVPTCVALDIVISISTVYGNYGVTQIQIMPIEIN